MERHYRQLTLDERCSIARLHEDGQSIRKIATALDRPPSTISRELKRNRGARSAYLPGHAHERAWARRWIGARMERDEALRDLVIGKLRIDWSPEQIAGWLKLQSGAQTISHESIYRFIDRQIRRTKDYRWRLLLPRQKSKRGWRGRKGGSSALHIKDRVSIGQRPVCVENRADAGHWEADLMLFSQYGQAALAIHERKTRFLLLTRQPSKAAEPIANQIVAWLAPMPESLRQTITFDNGTEFAFHHSIKAKLGIQTFFCDTHSPWQKGGVENAIGRLRRWMPRKTNLENIEPDLLQAFAHAYNNTPRKCLGFKTPAELFSTLAKPLHFECESTFPLSRE